MLEIKGKSFEKYISHDKLENKIKRLAKEVIETYSAEENNDFKDLVVIGVLNGAIPFFKDIVFQLPKEITMDFIKVSSYGSAMTSSGEIELVMDTKFDIKGKNILIIEDIVDSGLTQQFLLEHYKKREVKSIKVCSLFYKSVNSETGIAPDLFGFDIPDHFIIGYGLDYDQQGRNLKDIYIHNG